MKAPERTAHRRTLVVLALLIAVAIVVAGSAPLHRVSERAVTALAGLIADHPAWGVVAFVGLAALSAMLAFVSRSGPDVLFRVIAGIGLIIVVIPTALA